MLFVAYVSYKIEGLIEETPLKMGKALNGDSGLDVDKEKKLVEEGLEELKELEAEEKIISLTMKDLGTKRYAMITIVVFFFIIKHFEFMPLMSIFYLLKLLELRSHMSSVRCSPIDFECLNFI